MGSVAIVAIDDRQRVLLIRQYRHPAGHYLRELPAGLCDKPGELPLGAAQRELAEEAQLRAAAWRTGGRPAAIAGYQYGDMPGIPGRAAARRGAGGRQAG
jgi:8-oxo-dGTP pyrophosphatase MutT (NUDIX family)